MEQDPVADRFRRVAGTFAQRIAQVPADRWDAPAPCDGWVARDVVEHLVEWVPGFFDGVELGAIPPVGDDPGAAWGALQAGLQAILDDPARSDAIYEHPMAGTHRMEDAIATFVLGDVLVHTWDLARATGLDEALDPTEVHGMYEGMLPIDEMLRQSGQFGARVAVPDDADEQTKLIAFTGRNPDWGR